MADSLAIQGDVICDLPHYGLIEAKGEDARKFLASQVPGDVRIVTPELGLFTAWCDAKGRAQATFWMMMRGDAFYMVLPEAILAPTLAGLKRFLLRVKATLGDAGATVGRLGLSGPGLPAKLTELLGAAPPESIGATKSYAGCALMAIPGGPHPRWLALGEPEALAALKQSLIAGGAAPVESDTWNLLDILADVPLLVAETAGEFVPQMLNLEALGGICFNKGCYPGQEVIARLHYRGQLKRQLYRATLVSDTVPVPGAKLTGEGQAESVGEVVSAARHPDGHVTLLAVLKIEEKAQGPVRLGDAQGPVLAFAE